MKIKSILWLLPFTVLQANANPDIKEGLWEITSSVVMSGIAVEMPSITKQECISKQSLNPQQLLKDYNCQFEQNSSSSNSYSWSMSCDQQGIKMNGSGNLTYQYTTFNGQFDMQLNGGAGSVNISTSITGQYVGTCSN